MKSSNIIDRYLSAFEGETTECRRLYDHFVIFRRDGSIIGARANNRIFSVGKNFYGITDSTTADAVSLFSVSFEKKWLIIDTRLGKAAVFNSLFASSGLLFAIVFTPCDKAVCKYFSEFCAPVIAAATSLSVSQRKPASQKEVDAVKSSFEAADLALSHHFISGARYKMGSDIGKFLAEHLLSIAEFIGCTGECKSELDKLPNLEVFSPELFVVMSCCAVLFARKNTYNRHFKSKLINYKDFLMVSFSVNTDKKSRPYDCFAEYCESLANSKNAYFSYSLSSSDAGRLIFTFLPQAAPDMGSHVKQELEQLIKDFWSDEEQS